MNKEEVMTQYGDLPLKFASYYKYCFLYQGTAPDGTLVQLGYGSSSDDIYRYEVTPEKTVTLRGSGWHYATVSKDAKELWSESNY